MVGYVKHRSRVPLVYLWNISIAGENNCSKLFLNMQRVEWDLTMNIYGIAAL